MRRKAKDRTALEGKIGYKFVDKALLERALTHISALSGGNRANSYQRLANEGELSRRLADLVRKETCADVAKTMELGPALKLGASESKAGDVPATVVVSYFHLSVPSGFTA